MQELEEIHHLSVTGLEQAFRLIVDRNLREILPEELNGLAQSQWEAIAFLLFRLQSAQMRSQIH
jgi:hypothetical protein